MHPLPCHCFCNAVTRTRTEAAAATTQSTNHYTITASYRGSKSSFPRLTSSVLKAPPLDMSLFPPISHHCSPSVRRRISLLAFLISVSTRPQAGFHSFISREAVLEVSLLSARISKEVGRWVGADLPTCRI